MEIKAIVVGTSAGGLEALKTLLAIVRKPLNVPIIVIQHLSPHHDSYLPKILGLSGHEIDEVCDKLRIENKVYIAPPNYHVLIEKDFTFSLTVEDRVSYARPSIDVTFETASDAYNDGLLGILLTGANHDGAKGLKTIKENNGYTIVQDPRYSYANEMPLAALKVMKPNEVLDIEAIAHKINELVGVEYAR